MSSGPGFAHSPEQLRKKILDMESGFDFQVPQLVCLSLPVSPETATSQFSNFLITVTRHHRLAAGSSKVSHTFLLVNTERRCSYPMLNHLCTMLLALHRASLFEEAKLLGAVIFGNQYFLETQIAAGQAWLTHYFPYLEDDFYPPNWHEFSSSRFADSCLYNGFVFPHPVEVHAGLAS